jgi:tRNA-Thr(GGU) m(6)t(6)A37 methyltransferase TsaA
MFTITPVAWVGSTRVEPSDDNWDAEAATITLDDALPEESLTGLDEFSHLEVLFYFHKADPDKVEPGLRHPRNNPDWPKVGVFARRGKNRPNHLGLSVVKLIKREGRTLHVEGLDAIDGTPVIDIKPLLNGFLPRKPLLQPKWADEIMARYWR